MPVGNAKLNDLADAKTRRGFTDHEHLDDIELIHMNGRVYDYNLGRFMSVDPVIQSPTNSQSINPYSYIMNNPLSGIDPTGYCSTDDTMKGCADGLENGETQAITNADGDTVGYVGKDNQGNIHMTNNGSSKGQAAVSGSVESVDIGSPSTIQEVPINESSSSSALSEQKSSKLTDSNLGSDNIGGVSNEDFGSVNASYSDFKEDEDGNTIQATITSDSVCQKEAIDQGRITSTDISRSIMRLRMREYQGYAAGYSSIWAAGSARHIIYNISSFTFKQFRKFNELPTKQKEACISMFLGLCAQEVLRMNF
ncbi:RHS repeat domain-containing protein [Pseudoalteromonas sp. 68 DY56-GL68]|uniref:RHS repeat domain-containing protein n=1 Tax=Pseudoalteromonas sp. 68 DY56-GL68 TaxID=2974919 RepID=UPI00352B099C